MRKVSIGELELYEISWRSPCWALLLVVLMLIGGCNSNPKVTEIGDWSVIEQPDRVSDATLYKLRSTGVVGPDGLESTLQSTCWSYDPGLTPFTIRWVYPSGVPITLQDEGIMTYRIGDSMEELTYLYEMVRQTHFMDLQHRHYPAGHPRLLEEGLFADLLKGEVVLFEFLEQDDVEWMATFPVSSFQSALGHTPCEIRPLP